MADSEQSDRDRLAKYLHWPARADHLEDLEEHLRRAARTRRALVAGLVLAPIAGLPAVAGAAAGDDPIFAALAERKRLEAAHVAAIEAVDNLGFPTAPIERSKLDAAEQAQDEACSAVCDFELELFTTQPTTPAGALALLRFVANDLDYFTGLEAELKTAIRNAVAVLEGEARL